MSKQHLRRVAVAAKAADKADAALEKAIIEANNGGATLREIAAATGGRFRSPESIRTLIRRREA